MNQLSVRTATEVAGEINFIKHQASQMLVMSSIEIGRRLVEAKEMLPHGEWGKWLEESVNYQKSTANNLMKLYHEYGTGELALTEGNSNLQALGNLNYTQAVALLGIPAEDRVQFVEENNVEELSSRELQKLIQAQKKEQKELQLQLEETKKQADKERLEREKMAESFKEMEERSKLHYELAERYKSELEAASASGDQAEVERLNGLLKKANEDLRSSKAKVKDLQEEVKKKPIEVPAITVVEKVPADIEAELISLRQQLRSSNTSAVSKIKFDHSFEIIVNNFKEMLNIIEELEKSDPEEHKKYCKGTKEMLTRMLNSI